MSRYAPIPLQRGAPEHVYGIVLIVFSPEMEKRSKHESCRDVTRWTAADPVGKCNQL
jgi:hypothetical protein